MSAFNPKMGLSSPVNNDKRQRPEVVNRFLQMHLVKLRKFLSETYGNCLIPIIWLFLEVVDTDQYITSIINESRGFELTCPLRGSDCPLTANKAQLLLSLCPIRLWDIFKLIMSTALPKTWEMLLKNFELWQFHEGQIQEWNLSIFQSLSNAYANFWFFQAMNHNTYFQQVFSPYSCLLFPFFLIFLHKIIHS